jgi:hypothetical protein
MAETNFKGGTVDSRLVEAVGVEVVSSVPLTLDELEDYRGMTAVLTEYGFLYKGDMELLGAMVRRHECLRTLIPYAVSSDAKKRAFATKSVMLLHAAIQSVDETCEVIESS